MLIGGIFVIEALSVMLQVASFKYWGRRIFLMTPIHHHFEMKAWSETKIMVRFWIVTAIFAAAGFALYYAYYLSSSQPGTRVVSRTFACPLARAASPPCGVLSYVSI